MDISLYNKIIEKHPDASVYLDVFDGGHEIDMETAEYWIMSQYKKKNKTAPTGIPYLKRYLLIKKGRPHRFVTLSRIQDFLAKVLIFL